MITDAKLRTLKYKHLESKGEKNRGQLLPNRIPDRDGMYASVSPAGTISFRYDYRWPQTSRGRRQCITYGKYPTLPLATSTDSTGKIVYGARDLHQEALRKLKQGINPMDERRQAKLQSGLPDDFKSVGERWYEKNKPGKSDSWLQANRRYLDAAYKHIGTRSIKDLTPQDLNAILAPIEAKGRAVTAEKMRQTLVMVFDHAAGKEFLIASGANPARVLRVDLPAAKHHAHLGISEVPAFLKAVEADDGSEQVRLAVKLLFLTLTRKMELCAAKWSEVDLDAARWEIPAERMKGKRTHIVPLSSQAVAIFRRLKELANGNDYVFPHRDRANQHMLGDTVNRVFIRTGYAGKATPHGCRSTASTALNEMGYSPDAIERQLSHIEADEVRASYNHADYMDLRRRMLQSWADAIDRLREGKPLVDSGNVIPLQTRAA